LNDPPRARAEGSSQFVSLETIREQADIISFHVPLNRQGIDKTFHMADADFLQDLRKKPLIINTCRGEVFDIEAVLKAREKNEISGMVIDCWENEPDINLALLKLVDFGTSHIAGYSRDGKANGTKTSVRAISRFFKLGINDWKPGDVAAPGHPVIDLDGTDRTQQAILADAVLATYQIENDDVALRSRTHLFEQLRGDYPARREFDAYSIRANNVEFETIEKLKKLGFMQLLD
jgi:erythronate-4-phosphate dehydrogenase